MDAVMQARQELSRLESDQRLLKSERDLCRLTVLGDVSAKPKTLGDARRLIACYKSALHTATTEIPW